MGVANFTPRLFIREYLCDRVASWLGHNSRMEAKRTVKRIYEWQPHARRKRGRPKIRWKDDVREYLKELGIYNWLTRTQDRSSWKEIDDQPKAFKK
jgi:hypothetical protein